MSIKGKILNRKSYFNDYLRRYIVKKSIISSVDDPRMKRKYLKMEIK